MFSDFLRLLGLKKPLPSRDGEQIKSGWLDPIEIKTSHVEMRGVDFTSSKSAYGAYVPGTVVGFSMEAPIVDFLEYGSTSRLYFTDVSICLSRRSAVFECEFTRCKIIIDAEVAENNILFHHCMFRDCEFNADILQFAKDCIITDSKEGKAA